MAIRNQEKNRTVWTLLSKDGGSQVRFIPEWGGVAFSMTVPSSAGPRELFYQHDYFWDPESVRIRGSWPYLFPVCGRMVRNGQEETYLLDGRIYRLPTHGFAPRMPWEVLDSPDADRIVLRLIDTPKTREQYPFSFEVRLEYRVEAGALICHQTVTNPGDRPLPYCCGFHPYFRTPAPGCGKENVLVDIPARRRLLYNDKLTDITGDAPPSPMPSSITNPEINETLSQIESATVCRLIYPDGFTIHLAEESSNPEPLFRYVQLYTIPEKPFFCIEHWTGHPNALNTVDGMRWIAAGAQETALFRMWTTP